MVQTRGPGDSFGNLTELGLYRALGLIAFCTDDYGAVTGAQYETFVELRYAHQNKLPIIPVQLCDTFPPEPPDEAISPLGIVFLFLFIYNPRGF